MSQTINVDITPNNFQPTLNYSQGDVGRTFSIKIVSQFGDTLPAGATVKIQATKPSGFGFDVTADSVTDNVATFTTTAEMTDEWGRFPAQLDVTKDAVTIFSAKFLMVGAKNTHPEGTIDGSQGTIIPELTLLVERVEAAASSVLDMEVEAQTLPAGSLATYSYDEDENKATFGIPQGEAGAGAAGVTASAYSASKTYAVGDYVIHNSNLYRCTTAITTAESFTAAHWTQVVLGDDVTDLKSAINDVEGEVFDDVPFVWELGSLSTSNGTPVDSTTRIRTDFISAKVGDHYAVANSENLLMFYEYDANKTLTRVSASGNFWYEAISQTNAFIRIVMRKDTSNSTITQADIPTITAKLSPNTKKESKIIPLEESVDELKEELYNTESWGFESETVGKYVNLSGTESTNGSFNISKPINLSKGDSVDFYAKGYDTVVGMISEVTGTNTYSVLVRSLDSTLHTYTYTATSDITIALCYNNSYSHSCEIKRLNYMQKGSVEVYPDYLSLFKNCACIGDSLTRGYQAEMPSGEKNRDGGYPTRLSRMTRLNVYNFGLSGASPTGWLANTTLADYDYSGFDVALICLGRNGGLSSETDQQSYATIINKLKTANSNMTIFCLSLPPSDTDDTAINAIIENIAENNDAYYVDISNNTELSNSAFRYDGVHYYPLGYDLLADLIKKRLCKYINDNKSAFMQIYTPKTYPDIIAGLVE